MIVWKVEVEEVSLEAEVEASGRESRRLNFDDVITLVIAHRRVLATLVSPNL